MAANPVARGTELAISLRVKGWLFFPALSPPLLPLPHPCGSAWICWSSSEKLPSWSELLSVPYSISSRQGGSHQFGSGAAVAAASAASSQKTWRRKEGEREGKGKGGKKKGEGE